MPIDKRHRTRRTKKHKQRQLCSVALFALSAAALTIAGFVLRRGQSVAGDSQNELVSVDRQARFDLDPILGDPDAPVTIVKYGAYGCPACRAWNRAGVIQDILAEFPGQVKFTFRDFPVILPDYDHRAAEMAQCALDQSNDAFWRLHDALYETVQSGAPADQIFAAAGNSDLICRPCAPVTRREPTGPQSITT